MSLKQFYTVVYMVLICVETNWSRSWFAMAVLGCRSLVLRVVILIIIVITISAFHVLSTTYLF